MATTKRSALKFGTGSVRSLGPAVASDRSPAGRGGRDGCPRACRADQQAGTVLLGTAVSRKQGGGVNCSTSPWRWRPRPPRPVSSTTATVPIGGAGSTRAPVRLAKAPPPLPGAAWRPAKTTLRSWAVVTCSARTRRRRAPRGEHAAQTGRCAGCSRPAACRTAPSWGWRRSPLRTDHRA